MSASTITSAPETSHQIKRDALSDFHDKQMQKFLAREHPQKLPAFYAAIREERPDSPALPENQVQNSR